MRIIIIKIRVIDLWGNSRHLSNLIKSVFSCVLSHLFSSYLFVIILQHTLVFTQDLWQVPTQINQIVGGWSANRSVGKSSGECCSADY